jgi:hypothetical protein
VSANGAVTDSGTSESEVLTAWRAYAGFIFACNAIQLIMSFLALAWRVAAGGLSEADGGGKAKGFD